ncbi:LLM class flavin-dependent oxidoreductase [Tsukamurella sp. 1534]|uniref:LLM class flavin-dependent oxidoreductase n=1 Tax=Tsukamurella sp. 1534 TaxID=1151061 RepID=UPI0002ED8F7C|nr:LLM class flavin-dependent oxidoreductase [Tsukamurella sp. 1534]
MTGPATAPRFGSAPFALSVLDNAHTAVGSTVEDAYRAVIDLAQLAERRGYHRFWMSEHHAMPAAATPSPQLMLARLTGETSRIRLGAGGVMLPNHAPLVIAEQFRMLDALAPGRIDLGLGRAPGTDAATAAALRRHRTANDEFPQQVVELLGFLADRFPPGHPYHAVHAVPGPWQAEQNRVPAPATAPEAWILGTSAQSAQLAARLGRPYAFALQFGGGDAAAALDLYRGAFRPSPVLAAPYAASSVGAVADHDAERAEAQARSAAMAMLRMVTRRSYALLPPDEVAEHPATDEERRVLDGYTERFVNGTPARVASRLDALHARTGADEIMLVTMGPSREAHRRTVDLIADHYAPEPPGA